MNIIDYFIKRLSEEDTSAKWKVIDAADVNELLKDSVFKKAEPINYPLTDGLLMCILDPTGRLLLLDIGNDTLAADGEDSFFIRAATPYSFRFVKVKDKWCILF